MKELILTIINEKGSRHFSKNIKKLYSDIYNELLDKTLFLDHLNPRIIDRVNYYVNDINNIPECLECNTQIVKLTSTFCSKKCMDSSNTLKKRKEETFLKNYGVTNVAKSDYFKDKYKEVMIERYGVEHYSKTSEFSQKYKNTSNEKYGVDNPAKSNLIKEKTEITNINKYGFKTPLLNDNVKLKSKNTLKEKYNVDHNSNIPDRNDKMKESSRIKFNTDHPMQNSDVFEKCMKNSHRFKEYVLPSGKIVKIQGYENLALDKLLAKYDESDIIIGTKNISNEIGIIEYTLNGVKHVYHPDIYIKSIHTVIEVKSSYTMGCDIEKNNAKKNAVLIKGINFKFEIF